MKRELSVDVVLLPAGFELLTAVIIKSSIFRDIELCTSLKISQCFGGKSLVPQERITVMRVASRAFAPYLFQAGFLLGLFFDIDSRSVMSLQNVGLL
jgi:hypothetical protein